MMKKILMVLVLLAVAVSAFALDDGNSLYKTWQAYQRWQKSPTTASRDDCVGAGWYAGYVQSTVSILIDMGKLEVPDNTTWEVGYTLVGKYLEKNPKKWGEFAAFLIFSAFVEMYGFPEEEQDSSLKDPNA